jgi:hypothetical protein
MSSTGQEPTQGQEPRLPYSDEILEHLLAAARATDRPALEELERFHRPLIEWVVGKYASQLPREQLYVCARFAFEQVARHEEVNAHDFPGLASLRMREEIETTIRYRP